MFPLCHAVFTYVVDSALLLCRRVTRRDRSMYSQLRLSFPTSHLLMTLKMRTALCAWTISAAQDLCLVDIMCAAAPVQRRSYKSRGCARCVAPYLTATTMWSRTRTLQRCYTCVL